MNRILVPFVLVAIAVGGVFWFVRGRGGQQGAAPPSTSTPRTIPAPADTKPAESSSTPVVGEQQRVASPDSPAKTPQEPVDPAAAARARREMIESQWDKAWGNSSKAELETLVAQMRPGARELYEKLFEQYHDRAETLWVDIELDEFAVEERYPRPGSYPLAHLVEVDKPSGKAHFEIVYVTPAESQELDDMQRLMEWLNAKLAAAGK
jgi:hypothetical protein